MSEASSPYDEAITDNTGNTSYNSTSNAAKDAVESQLQELLQSLLDLSIIVYDFQPDGNRLVWNKM
jgi:mediator of RNA polymerase II transcription subunit 10